MKERAAVDSPRSIDPCCGPLLLLGLSLAIGFGWSSLVSRQNPAIEFGPALGLVLAGVALAWLPRALIERKLGPVTVDAPGEVAPGETLVVRLLFRPRGRVRPRQIAVRLRAENDLPERTEVLWNEARILSAPEVIEPGEAVELRAELLISPQAPVSGRGISWQLDITVSLRGLLGEWRVDRPIRVAPRTIAEVPPLSLEVQSGQRCPLCRDSIAGPGSPPIRPCPSCGTVLHEDCWAENRGCTTAGCADSPRPSERSREPG